MSAESQVGPEAVFVKAQRAMAERDYETFFSCFSRNGLKRVTENALSLPIWEDTPDFLDLCRTFAVPLETFRDLRTRQAWAAYRSAVSDYLKTAPLVPLTAALERYVRERGRGGSVSSELFQNEVLENVQVEGNRAWGLRKRDSYSQWLGFGLERGEWTIRSQSKPPKRLGLKAE